MVPKMSALSYGPILFEINFKIFFLSRFLSLTVWDLFLSEVEIAKELFICIYFLINQTKPNLFTCQAHLSLSIGLL